MVDIESIDKLKDYFKKIQKVLLFEADLKIFGYELIKKDKIDDVLCCILATFPEKYKKMMKLKEGEKLGSIIAYNLLFKSIKQKFIFNSNVYLVSYDNAIRYINTILRDLERDAEWAEKHVQ